MQTVESDTSAMALSEIRYIRDSSVISRQIGEETVLVPIRKNLGDLENIYTLNPTAAAVWKLLETPQTVESLAENVASEYNVSLTQAESDVTEFLQQMNTLRLAEAAPDA